MLEQYTTCTPWGTEVWVWGKVDISLFGMPTFKKINKIKILGYPLQEWVNGNMLHTMSKGSFRQEAGSMEIGVHFQFDPLAQHILDLSALIVWGSSGEIMETGMNGNGFSCEIRVLGKCSWCGAKAGLDVVTSRGSIWYWDFSDDSAFYREPQCPAGAVGLFYKSVINQKWY